MLRISKLADYALLLTQELGKQTSLITLEPLAQASRLQIATVRKVIRLLVNAKIVESIRGAHGGYRLATTTERISIADVIEAIEGPIALTECVKVEGCNCSIESECSTKGNWQLVNQIILKNLHQISVAQMTHPLNELNSLTKAITIQDRIVPPVMS